MTKEEEIMLLIQSNEKLIYKLAYKYSKYYNIDDLYQVGIIGLIKAYNHYDIKSNAKFSSYAYKYILGEIIEYIRKDRNIIVSDEIFSIYKKYLHIKDLFFSINEREASLSEIANYMQLNENYLIHIIESVAFTKSIEEDNNYYYDNRDSVDNEILLNEEIDALNQFDKSIIDYRYYQGFTQSETASIMGISQVKVSREEKLILSKMKNSLTN